MTCPPRLVLRPPNEILLYPSPTSAVPLARVRSRLEALGWAVTVAPPQPPWMAQHLLVWPGVRAGLVEGDALLRRLQSCAEGPDDGAELPPDLRFEGPTPNHHLVFPPFSLLPPPSLGVSAMARILDVNALFARIERKAAKAATQQPRVPGFHRWIDTFVAEKGLDREECFEVEGPSGPNLIPLGCVIDLAKSAPATEQAAIKSQIVRLDFANADVRGFFKHLAKAVAK